MAITDHRKFDPAVDLWTDGSLPALGQHVRLKPDRAALHPEPFRDRLLCVLAIGIFPVVGRMCVRVGNSRIDTYTETLDYLEVRDIEPWPA